MTKSPKSRWIAALVLAATVLTGCIVAPVGPGYDAPPGVVYVAPTYAIPAPGYVWGHHARFGWGWRHPHLGWHRGWR